MHCVLCLPASLGRPRELTSRLVLVSYKWRGPVVRSTSLGAKVRAASQICVGGARSNRNDSNHKVTGINVRHNVTSDATGSLAKQPRESRLSFLSFWLLGMSQICEPDLTV